MVGESATRQRPGHRGRPGQVAPPVASPARDRSFYTERSLAAYLAVSDRLIRKWVKEGRLRSYKLGGCRRFDPADVAAFLAEHRDERSRA